NAMAGSVSSGTSILRMVSYESRLRLTPPSAIASCASLSSMPISFSAWCIISFVMRGAGVGDGLGDGDGEGVCASASSGSFEAVRPAAPRAGRSFTKVRRSTRGFELLFFFIGLVRILGKLCAQYGSGAEARRDYHRRHQVCRLKIKVAASHSSSRAESAAANGVRRLRRHDARLAGAGTIRLSRDRERRRRVVQSVRRVLPAESAAARALPGTH